MDLRTTITRFARLIGLCGPQQGGTGLDGSAAPAGSLLIGNGSGYSLATLTPGPGIAITNAAGAVQVAATGGGGLAIGAAVTGGTAGRVLYEDGSNKLAEAAGLSFDGTNLATGGSISTTATTNGNLTWSLINESAGASAFATFQVGRSVGGNLTFQFLYTSENNNILVPLAAYLLASAGTTGGIVLATAGAAPIRLQTNNLTRLTIDPAGKATFAGAVAISGTTAAIAYLDGTGTVTPLSIGTGLALTEGTLATDGTLAIRTLTGATTLTAADLGKTIVIAGTGPYTVTLPGAVASAGSSIDIVVAPTFTGALTIAPNGPDTVGGRASRVQWAGESKTLAAIGPDWAKVGGVSRPMTCVMRLTDGSNIGQAQAVPSDLTDHPVDLNTVDPGADPTGLMADTTNHQIHVIRTGTYQVTPFVIYGSTRGTSPYFSAKFGVNGTSIHGFNYPGATTGLYATPTASFLCTLNSGDAVQLRTGHSSTSATEYLYGDPAGESPVLGLVEIPDW